MKIKNYEELRKRRQAHLTEKEFEGEREIAEMEKELKFHGPGKDESPAVVSTGNFRTDPGDYDRTE